MDVRARFSLILEKLKDEDVEVLLKIAEWLLEEYLTEEDRDLLEAEVNAERAIWEKAHWKGDEKPERGDTEDSP
jgi:predicted ATP-dependent Lon-type protease